MRGVRLAAVYSGTGLESRMLRTFFAGNLCSIGQNSDFIPLKMVIRT